MGGVIFWVILAIIVIAIDITTSSFLFVWFAVGAFIAMIAALLGASVWMQILLFFIFSIITVSIGYPWAKKNMKTSVAHTPLMEEKYIGMVMKAENTISEKGRIKVGGIYWAAKNIGEIIEKGSKYKIIGIEGNKLIIKKEGDV